MHHHAQTITLRTNAQPFLLFAELFERALKPSDRALRLSDLPPELIRVESDDSTAAAGELTVTLYPSDAFLRFAAAVLAPDVNPGAVEGQIHKSPLKKLPASSLRHAGRAGKSPSKR